MIIQFISPLLLYSPIPIGLEMICATRNTYISKHNLMSIEIKTSKYIHEKGGDCGEQWFYEMARL